MVEERALQLAPPPGHCLPHLGFPSPICFQPFWNYFLFCIYSFSLFMPGPTHPPKTAHQAQTQPQALHHQDPPPVHHDPSDLLVDPLAPSTFPTLPLLLLRSCSLSCSCASYLFHSLTPVQCVWPSVKFQARMRLTLSCSSSRTWLPSTRQASNHLQAILTSIVFLCFWSFSYD